MKAKELTHEQMDKVIRLRQIGASWLKIQSQTGINRRTAKRAYEKWEHSKSLEELKEARKDVAAQAFREHMDSLVTLATSLVTNLSVPDSLDFMDRNAEQFFWGLFKQDLLQSRIYITSPQAMKAYASRPIVDQQPYHREQELLLESLKVHTRERVRWEEVLDNRWKKAKDNCAKIVPKLRKGTSEVVNNYINQERYVNLLQSIKRESGESNPVKQVVEGVLREIWRAILQTKLDKEDPWFETVLRGKGTPQEINVKARGGDPLLKFFGDTNMNLAEKVTRICNLTANNLCKGDMVQQLYCEVRDMKIASEELREMLNPVKLRPMILRTRCELCPA